MSRTIAVILAGGSGTRIGGDVPKQFVQVAGKTVLEHTLDAFERHPLIDEIAVVSKDEYIQATERLVSDGKYRKVRQVLIGGKERYDSSMAAIHAYENDEDILLIHDAARPLVTERIITDCVAAMQAYDAVDVALETTDTIVEVDEKGCIRSIPQRARLRNVQTPQCFRRGVIKQAYTLALNDPNFTTTDDCGVVHRYLPQIPIYIVKGDACNLKITYSEDLALAERLLKDREK